MFFVNLAQCKFIKRILNLQQCVDYADITDGDDWTIACQEHTKCFAIITLKCLSAYMYTVAVIKFADVQFPSHARETSDYAKKCGGYFLFIITKPMRPSPSSPPSLPPPLYPSVYARYTLAGYSSK